MAIRYTFGEAFTGGLTTGSTIRAQAEDQKLKAERLKEEITARKERNQITRSMNKLREDQLAATVTGYYDGKETLPLKQFNLLKDIQYGPQDMSLLKGYMEPEQLTKLTDAGVDLKAVDYRTAEIMKSILSSDISRRTTVADEERRLKPIARWVNPEDDDLGWGYDQGEVRDDARVWLSAAKSDMAVIKAVKKYNPKSQVVAHYEKQLGRLKTDLSSKYFTGSWEGRMPSGRDAANMVKDIEEILEFIKG